MTRDQAIDILLARLGQRGNDAVLKAAAVLELNFAQERLEGDKFKAWFLLSSLRSIDTVAGDENLTLPSDFLSEVDEGALWRYDAAATTKMIELGKTDYDLGQQRYPTASIPLQYSLGASQFHLHPTPDAIYPMRYRCYARIAQITAAYGQPEGAGTNLWLTHAADWLIAATGVVLATAYTRDAEVAGIFVANEAAARARVYTETIARQEANYARSMGDD